jgi:ankyrin repeat protein
LLKKSEYQDWLDFNNIFEHHGFLWIKGKPGTGKSTMMKFALAQAKKTRTDTIIISFFFNARGEVLEKSTVGMYRSLLVQLLEKIPELQSLLDFLGLALPSKSDSYRWDIEILKELFRCAVEQLGQRRLTCFIDALDECEENQVRDMVADFEHLGQLAFSARVQFRVCFSSRHYPHITIEKGLQLTLEGQDGHNEDIANYLHSELKAGHSKQVEQVRAEIIEKASGIFMWVVLVVQMLNKEYDRGRIHALRKKLQGIPAGLNELFKDILTRDCQNMEELLLCLQWVLYAKRPLKQEELYFAILSGAEPEALTAWSPEETTKQDMERFILSSSKGLAEVTKFKGQTVQFIHESVRDFLLKENGLDDLWSDFGTTIPSLSHERLKQCCYNYMTMDTSEHLLLSMPLPTASSTEAANLRQLASEKFPFLEYAVCNVLYHADLAEGGGAPQDAFIKHFPLGDWITLDNLIERYQIRRHTNNADLLYILAEENLPNLIRTQLRRVSNIDIIGERYCFPIFAALASGNKNAVRALLIPDTGPQPSSDVPHSVDSQYHQDLLKLIANGRDIKPRNGQTLLSCAVERGDIPIVRLLLATGKVDLDVRDKYGQTLLLLAVEYGHEAVVKLLLTAGCVDVDSRANNGQTPLLWAAQNGHEAVVKLLLATGRVDVDSRANNGQTPLSWAAKNGREAVVKLLLATGRVEVDSRANNGQTPLSWAAKNGREAVVKLLLATGRIDLDSKDYNGRTPLSYAAQNGHEAVVKLLLMTGRVDLDSKGNYGRTPLSYTAHNGHEAVFKLLLMTGRVDLDSKDTIFGQTPLSWAAQNGHEAVVNLLLATGRVDVDSKNNDGQTPLSWAAENGQEAVVKLLLATGRIDVDSKDNDGRTPLWWAARSGRDAVVKLLLATGLVNVDSKDATFRQTPLSRVAEIGHGAVVKLLLATGRVDIDSKDCNGRTPLQWATNRGHEAVVKLLLMAGCVDLNSKADDS